MTSLLLKSRKVDKLHVRIYETRAAMGSTAAASVEECIAGLLRSQETVRMIFAAAPSQNEMLEDLARSTRIDWTRVEAFHMDEYLGLPAGSEQAFSAFLDRAIFQKVPFKNVYRIDPSANAEAECQRYAELLQAAPIDIVCMGVGENGHLAFNDPPVADFADPYWVKVVELDTACRTQQVNDGCFPNLQAVPTHALTLTLPALLAGRSLFCVVPGPTKRQAVTRLLTGVVEKDCPASILRMHDRCVLFLDKAAAEDVQ